MPIGTRPSLGELVREGPTADLGAVEFEGVQAKGLGSGKAVRTWGRADPPFYEPVRNGLRLRGGLIAPGSSGGPATVWMLAAVFFEHFQAVTWPADKAWASSALSLWFM